MIDPLTTYGYAFLVIGLLIPGLIGIRAVRLKRVTFEFRSSVSISLTGHRAVIWGIVATGSAVLTFAALLPLPIAPARVTVALVAGFGCVFVNIAVFAIEAFIESLVHMRERAALEYKAKAKPKLKHEQADSSQETATLADQNALVLPDTIPTIDPLEHRGTFRLHDDGEVVEDE
jgi:hypothetical protein